MSGFRLRRIEVSRFQQFREPVVVEGLEEGLNVVAGRNEAGKSTLLRAIRAVLFERYGRTAGDLYRPHGAAVSPSVSLDFTVAGIDYHLEKVFSKKKDGHALLEAGNGQRWEGPQAEEYLAELLGFAYPGRGASRPELQGLAGLLWVEQGVAHHPVILGDGQREQVQGVFEQEMRELLGGERGEALFQRIQARRAEYFDRRDKPRGEYRKLRERAETLAASLVEAQEALQAYEQQVDQLDRVEERLGEFRRERLIEQARQRLGTLRQAVERIGHIEATIAREKTGVAQAELARGRAQKALDDRRAAAIAVEEAERELEAARQKTTRLAAELGRLTQRRDALQQAVEATQHRLDGLEAELRNARERQELDHLEQERAEVVERLEKAQQLDEQRRRAQVEEAALGVTSVDLDELEAAQHACDLAEERLRAVATRLAYDLAPGVEARLAGEAVEGSDERLLTRETVLEIAGVGRLRIRPGGEDLETVQAELEGHRVRLRQRLRELGVENLAEARHQVQRRQALSQAASQADAELKGLLPKQGLAGLQDLVQTLDARIAAARQRLGEATERTRDLEAIETEVEVQRTERQGHEAELAGLREALSGLRGQLEEARARQREIERRRAAAIEALQAARGEQSDRALQEALAAADQMVAERRRVLADAEAALDAEQPEVVRGEIERAERVMEDLRRDKAELEQEAVRLQAVLDTLGQQGLAEQLAALEVESSQARRELAQADRQAHALDLLTRTLEASLQRAREAVARPIVERVVVYLRQLIPDAEPVVDESLGLKGLRRNGVEEPFESLSIGTREQLAVLVRLAYADLLAEAGMPASVVLDDALVNSDDERRDRMKAILYQAARRYQVLVLTCHGREYRDAGGKFLRLDG